jgi:hypothetical protein
MLVTFNKVYSHIRIQRLCFTAERLMVKDSHVVRMVQALDYHNQTTKQEYRV